MAYEDLFDPADDKKAKAGLNLRYGIEAAPDLAARDAALAKRYGLPAGVIEQYRPDYDARAKVEDAGQMLDQSPKLRDWLAADPVRAKVSHDDIGNLSAIESAVRYLVSAPGAPRGGLLSDVGNLGVSALKGAVGLPQAVVGLADIPTLGRAGKLAESAGLRFKDAQSILDTFYSDAQQQANKEVADASGFLGTLGAMARNPSTIVQTGVESLPLMLGGAGVARGLLAAGGKAVAPGMAGPALPGFLARTFGQAAPLVAGAVGEGVIAAGSAAENYREAGGVLTVGQVAAAIASGTGTGALSVIGGKVAQKLGVADIDTALASGALKGEEVKKGLIRTLAEAGVSEGLLEEMPQSAQEQIWQNIATGKPVMEGVAEAAAQGLMAGAATGGAFAGVSRRFSRESQGAAQAQMAGQQLDTIAALAEASKLKARSPETFAEFANELAQSSVPAIFIDAQALMQSGVNIQEVAQAMPSVAAQLQEAVATGGDIEIPTAEFVQGVPGSTFQQQLIDHARTGANAMSRAEAEVFMSEKGDTIKAEIEAEAARHEQDADWQMQRNEVRDGFEQQLNAAGRFQPAVNKSYAAVLGDFYAVTASRAGMTPKELVQRYPLRIQATAPGGAVNAMEQGDGLPYQIDHKPMTKEGGASTLDDLTGAFGEDIYGKDALQFFGSGDAREKGVLRTLKALRGKPDAMVTIYRGVPAEAAGINPGDWVTISKEAAQDYADQHPGGKIVSMQVLASHVTGWADSLMEFGYHPPRAALNQSAHLPATIDIDGQQRPTTNSKGQQIAATEEGVRNFWRWFGGSTAVDQDGRPLVVYHGTAADLTEFSRAALGASTEANSAKQAFFVTDSPTVASGYAQMSNTRPGLQSARMKAIAKSDLVSPELRAIIERKADEITASPEALSESWWIHGAGGGVSGANVLPLYVKIETPLAMDYKGKDYRERSFAALLQEAKDENRDGAIFLNAEDSAHKEYSEISNIFAVFNPDQLKSATGNSGAFEPYNPSILDQSAAEPRDLIVAHNLSADNLRHALEIGGLPAPSLAITKVDSPIQGFGEITLIGDTKLAAPSAKNPVFNADVYSPRFPDVKVKVDVKKVMAALKPIAAAAQAAGIYSVDPERVAEDMAGNHLDRAIGDVVHNDGMRYGYATQVLGLTVDVPMKTEPGSPAGKANASLAHQEPLASYLKTIDLNTVESGSPESAILMQKVHAATVNKQLARATELGKPDPVAFAVEMANRVGKMWGKGAITTDDLGDGAIAKIPERMTDEALYQLYKIVNDTPAPAVPDRQVVDTSALSQKLDEVVDKEAMRAWAREQLQPAMGEKRIAKEGGKSTAYTLDNLVKEMTKKVRDAEGFNYGLGNARSRGATKFKNLKDVQGRRDQVQSKADADAAIKANEDRFLALVNRAAEFFPSEKERYGRKTWEALPDVIGESYGAGVERALADNGFKGVPVDLAADLKQFAADLVNLPTEYFEAKPQRAVGVDEFKGAVVPSTAPADVRAALAGLGIRTVDYTKGDEADRARAVKELAGQLDDGNGNVLFQGEQARAQISFGPSIADSGAIISLLESADLSSFVHEVGHLFLEIQADLASRIQANIDAGENVTEGERQIVADMGKLTEWFGAQDHARAMKDIDASVDAAIETAKKSAEKAGRTGDAKDKAQAAKDKAQADRMLAALNWLNSKGREGYLSEASRNWFAEVPTEHRLILATPYHETFARGWERYAFEGNSPNLELQTIFQRFAAWMKSIYRTLTSLNVNLTDEVRGVMDRMIATDEQIRESETARAMGPLFTEQGGMTPEQWAAYQAQGDKATQTAVDALQARALADMKWLSNARAAKLRELQKQADALRRDIRREVTREVMSRPVYRAWTFLTGKGEADQKAQAEPRVKGSSGALDPAVDNIFQAIAKLGGLRRDEVQSQWGLDSKAETISSGVFGRPVVRKEGGLSIDMMTEALVAEGYLMADENGRGDPRDLEEAFDSQRMGVDQFSVAHDYAARAAAANGDEPADPLPDYVTHGKLSTTVLREMYGTQAGAIWRKLSDRRMTSESGIQPDVLAETMGFASGDAMVRELADARPPRDMIRDLTDQRMLQEHGELSTPEGLDKATTEALANKVRTRFLATELRALEDAGKAEDEPGKDGKARRTASALDKAAEVYAANTIGAMKIEDIKPHKFEAAATRAARLAAKAFKSGKTAEAAMHKRSELIQMHAAKAAHEALAEVQKARDHFGDIVRRSLDKLGKTYDVDVVQAIRAVLAEYGVGTRGEQAAKYLEAVERNDPDMHKVLQAQIAGLTANAKPIDTLTVDSLRALVDEVGAMWHLARRSKQMEVDGNLIDREEVQAELLARLEVIGIPDTMPGEGKAVTDKERRISRIREAGAALMRVENWAIRKDGADNGVFTRFVFRPIKAASDAYRAERGQVLRKYRDLLAGVNMGVGRISAPELGYEFGFSKGGSGKAELMHAILHTGNDSNKRKLLLGRKWADVMQDGETVDTGRWERFIERMIREGVLTKADFDFAQGVWDLLESLKPAAQKTHRDVFGRYFDEITANPVTNSLGTWAGGYVPAMTDAEVVKDAKTRDLAEAENSTMAFAFPATAKGFTKARVEYNKPLLLDLRALAGHIDKVLLFSHLEQPVRDVRRVLASGQVAEPMHKVDPAAFGSLITPWLNRAARQQVETPIPGDGGAMRVLSKLRARAGMAAMMANISNTAQQITGFSIAAVKVPPRHLMSAAHRWITSPRKTSEAVSEASVYMRNRMDNETAMMTQEIQAILLNPSLYEKAQDWTARHAYFMQSAVDNVMGPIIWTGAYNNALEQGQSEDDASATADGVVRQTQGSTLPEDISRIETGNAWWRMFAQFAGYFNMQANLLGTEFSNSMHDVGLRKGMGKGLMIFTLGFAVPALLSELIVQAFRGGPDDEDKDGTTLDDWFAALGIGQVRSAVAMVPVVGQLGGYAINLSNDKPYDDRISTAPAVSMLESAVRAPFSVYEAAVNDKSGQKAVRDVATLMSITTGLPFNAIARPVGYAAGMADDRIDPTSPADAARGLLTGVASPASKP